MPVDLAERLRASCAKPCEDAYRAVAPASLVALLDTGGTWPPRR